ncbi:BRO1 domain-containing protein BROX-like [Haliotis rufescens]|uniref:BRO1 domain-containing protein BROX-like n=1 Tax=Haliotis rufescens TaxID=6454 RepID=UPI00201F9FAD|nr:BRO1 domain-containing protein BROX-like [Haliotis rufescens]
MAYWFHRNPLKATASVTFELHGVSTNDQTRKIFSDLRMTRSKLLELLTDPNHDKIVVEKATNDYFSLLLGMYMSFKQDEPENKLRKIIRFKWSSTLLGNVTMAHNDVIFEFASMGINVALWYTKHAAKLAAKEDPDMDEAKEVHKCLRIAAGLFTYIKNDLVGQLSTEEEVKGADIDTRVLEAYINQCTGEAQEVTLARAIEMKHNPSLIAALAAETGQMYQKADDALASLDVKVVGKWKKYFQLKSNFYLAYAHSYNGETLLAADKCGDAIRGLKESVTLYDKASLLAKEYATTKGPGTTARPADHVFFRRLGPVVKRTLEKCERENGLIYHQKVTYDPPQLELKATYGLVSPEDYQPPSMNPLWNVDSYSKFNVQMAPKPEKKSEKEESLPPVKEKEVPMSDKDPKNVSGCVVS